MAFKVASASAGPNDGIWSAAIVPSQVVRSITAAVGVVCATLLSLWSDSGPTLSGYIVGLKSVNLVNTPCEN